MKTEKTYGPSPDLWPKAVARVPALEFRSAPLLTAVCWFALGEVIARNRQPTVILLIATVLLCLLTLAALRWSLRTAIVPLAAVWMATGCWCAKIQIVPPSQQALASYADGLSRQIRGRVIRVRELPPQHDVLDHDKETGWRPEKEEDEEAAAIGLLSADIQVDSIEEVTPDISRMVPMTGGVRINVIPDKSENRGQMNSIAAVDVLPTLRCGDIVEAPMRIKLAERYRDPRRLAVRGLPLGAGYRRSCQRTSIEDRGAQRVGRWSCDPSRPRSATPMQSLRSTELGFATHVWVRTFQGKSDAPKGATP